MFYIDYEGEWYHEGGVIRRHALKKLFSDKALSMDHEGRYWLSSPEARYPVQVEDVPFVVIDFDIHVTSAQSQDISLRTNMGDRMMLTSEQKLFLRTESRRRQIVPYVEVRHGLLARLGRSVWMNLVNRALEQTQGTSDNILTIYSGGYFHPLGEMQDA
jgi:hypothetical protein